MRPPVAKCFGTHERIVRERNLRTWVSTFPTPHAGGPFARTHDIVRDHLRKSSYLQRGPDFGRMFKGVEVYFTPDKVHPNGPGYVAIAMAWLELLDDKGELRDSD